MSEFRQLKLASRRVVIVENLTTFLAFPAGPDAVAIWGGGFAVSLLAGANWLLGKQLFYWGDMRYSRAWFPATGAAAGALPRRAVAADGCGHLRRYHGGGRGAGFVAQEVPQLTAAGRALYQELLRTNARLEQAQEQLPMAYVAAAVAAPPPEVLAGLP